MDENSKKIMDSSLLYKEVCNWNGIAIALIVMERKDTDGFLLSMNIYPQADYEELEKMSSDNTLSRFKLHIYSVTITGTFSTNRK